MKIRVPKDLPAVGIIVLDHNPTGKLYHEVSNHIDKSVDTLLRSLETNTAHKALQKLYNAECDFRLTVVACKGIREAKAQLKAIRADLPDHLKVN